ncbi:hypothetical protein HYT23_06015 [Candidatus Pacearchaeota archaeon]|nr:hypothetical protein [Candidatus Pacearchaeota archaeon]
MDYESIRPYTRIISRIVVLLLFTFLIYFIYRVRLKKEKIEKPIIKTINLTFWIFLIIPSAIIILIIILGSVLGALRGTLTFPLGILVILLIALAFLILGIVGIRKMSKYQK